jgi:hypothetical protein
MTQKLQELFNLPIADLNATVEEAEQTIEKNHAIIAEVDSAIDKIDAALPFVDELDISDNELDELSELAKEKFQDLMDLGMNVEARFCGSILQTAGTLLGHAIAAKQAKIDRKLRTIDLQLKKARLDQTAQKSEGQKILDATDGGGVVLDRNELLKQILGNTIKT